MAGGTKLGTVLGLLFMRPLDLDFFFQLGGVVVDLHLADRAVALAGQAPAVGRVEGEEARVEFVEGAARSRDVEGGAVDGLAAPVVEDVEGVPAQRQRGLDQAALLGLGLLLGKVAEDDIDGVLGEAVERLELGRLDPFLVDPQGGIALLGGPLGDLGVEALARFDERCEEGELACFFQMVAEPRRHLGGGLADGGLAGLGIVGGAELGVEEAEELVDLGDGGDSALAAAPGEPLLDGDGGRDAGDRIDLRLLHLVDELPRVGVEAVEVAPLALAEEDIEGQGRLARAAQAGDDGHLTPLDAEREVLQVVMAGVVDFDPVRRLGTGAEGGGLFADPGRLGLGLRLGGRELFLQEPPGGHPLERHFLGRALRDQLAATRARLGAELDDPIGRLDHVQIMLDHQDRVAPVDHPLEDRDQEADVLEVETGGRLVEDEKPFAGLGLGVGRGIGIGIGFAFLGLIGKGFAARQMADQLDPLGLAAGELVERLAEPEVAEADIAEEIERGGDLLVAAPHRQRHRGLRREEGPRLLHGQAEDLVDVLPPVADLEDVGLEPLPLASRAGQEDIGEELHLDLLDPRAAAARAAAGPAVEGKSPRREPLRRRRLGRGQQIPDRAPSAEVERGIRAGGPGERRLVDADDLADPLVAGEPGDGLAGEFGRHRALLAALLLGPLEIVVDHLMDQRTLARAAHPGDGDEEAERNFQVEPVEVVNLRPLDAEGATLLRRAAALGNLDAPFPAKESTGERAGVVE